MDYIEFFENEQFEEVLRYIEAYHMKYSDEEMDKFPMKYSDEEMDKFLNDFRIRGTHIKSVKSGQKYILRNFIITDRWNYDILDNIINIRFDASLTNNEGSSKDQLKLFKGILLSANYNFSRLEDESVSEKAKIGDDILNNTYGGKTFEDLEKLRFKTADIIKASEKFWIKITYLAYFGKYIYKALKTLAEYKLIKEAAEKSLLYDTAKRMIKDGISLDKVRSCLRLSPEEEEFIKKAETAEQEALFQSGEDEIKEKLSTKYLKI